MYDPGVINMKGNTMPNFNKGGSGGTPPPDKPPKE